MSRLAAGTEPTIVDRRHSRARVCRVDSGLVISRSRRSMSRAQPQAWSLARQCQEHGASRVIALAMSQRGNVASRRGDRADYRRSLSRTCARLSRRLGSCDLTVSPVDVSRAATGVVACASVPSARRLTRHRAGHEPTRPCRVSPRGLSRPSSVAVARVRASVAPTRSGSCVLTVASVDVSRAATDVVACASVPSARRLARHRAGREPARSMSRLAAGPSRLSSIAVTRVRASVASTRVLCSHGRVGRCLRAATGVVACASVPSARRLARHRAGHEPTRPCRVSPRGPSRLSSIAVTRVRASVASTRVL